MTLEQLLRASGVDYEESDLFKYLNSFCAEVIYDKNARGDENNSMIIALFPPAKAKSDAQFNNSTSRTIIAVIGSKYFNWNDVIPWSPLKRAKEMDQKFLRKQMVSRTPAALKLVLDMFGRLKTFLTAELAHGNALPVIIWAGKTANLARVWLLDLGLLTVDDNNSFATSVLQVSPWSSPEPFTELM